MAYATYEDVEARTGQTLTEAQQEICTTLLGDAALLIDAYNSEAAAANKLTVSCNMVIRAMGDGDPSIPMGAMQGSMSGLGYSQSWTMGSGGSARELYISKTDKKLLGYSNKIGSYSPVQEVCYERN